MQELTQDQQKILWCISRNSPISATRLGRNMVTGPKIMQPLRGFTINELIGLKLITEKVPFRLGKGSRPKIYNITDLGRQIIDEILELQRSLGAC